MIAICPNQFRDLNFEITLQAQRLLGNEGFDTCICPIFTDESGDTLPAGIELCSLASVTAYCSLIIVIGGDGTILAAARQLGNCQIPMLGINLGSKGFMTSLEPDELQYIVAAAKGNYRISRRMRLDVSLIRDGVQIYSDSVLNDAVLHGYGDCIKMKVYCSDTLISAFSGDGVILSTPTGSTGYSMSAGGPIVEPDVENIIISPICAHRIGSRSFVMRPDREVSVIIEKLHVRRAYLSLDGNSVIDLVNNDTVVVKRSAIYTNMADMGLRSFFDLAYDKLK